MYEITVERTFCAAHAITIGGRREPMHGHNWHVTATVAGPMLDGDGLLCDFHAVDRALEEICRPFDNGNLNETGAFADVNPSAEQVARHIADALSARLGATLAPPARVSAVRVTEASGCAATYRPGGGET
jgi:6-pyruvoyltetrahydropterin/6-carboxytetrahydropterin synthase